MLGPVFSLELLRGSRRGHLLLLRRAYAAWLVLQLIFLLVPELYRAWPAVEPGPGMARFIESYFEVFLAQHFLLIFLATPALVAGSITDEKGQRTLQDLLMADVNSWEIVAGKLFGRLAQVVFLTLPGVPLLFAVGGYGSVGWRTLAACAALSAALLFALGSLSIWASVYARQTRDAVVRVYVWCGLAAVGRAALLWGLPSVVTKVDARSLTGQVLAATFDVLRGFNLQAVLRDVWGQDDWGSLVRSLHGPLEVGAAVGVLFLGLAVWRLRPVALRQMEGAVRKPAKERARKDAYVDEDDPIRWKERLAGRKFGRRVAAVLLAAATIASGMWIVNLDWPELFMAQGCVASVLISVVVGIRASGSVSGERERQSWDSLLLTPLETWELVREKQIGTMQGYYPLVLAYAVPTLILAGSQGPVALVYAAAVVLLTWTSTFYMAATGVYCSVTSNSSYLSLVWTITRGAGYYLGLLLVFTVAYSGLMCISVPVLFVLAFLGLKNLTLVATMGTCLSACGMLTWFLWTRADNSIFYAKAWVDANERYGRTLARSLARALKKHEQVQAERRRARLAAAHEAEHSLAAAGPTTEIG
jgi:hypothetical protein